MYKKSRIKLLIVNIGIINWILERSESIVTIIIIIILILLFIINDLILIISIIVLKRK